MKQVDIIHGTSANIWLSYKQAISTHRNLCQKEINFPFRHLIRHTNPSKSFLKPASSRFRPKNHSYLRKMSILPDCRVFDYSANFSTHDSTVPNKTPRGIPMVLCVRSSVRDCGRVRYCNLSNSHRISSHFCAQNALGPRPYLCGHKGPYPCFTTHPSQITLIDIQSYFYP